MAEHEHDQFSRVINSAQTAQIIEGISSSEQMSVFTQSAHPQDPVDDYNRRLVIYRHHSHVYDVR